MEDKIEVEEYVRTEDGIIDKVTEYRADCHVYYCEKEMIIDEDNSIGTPLKQIVKHSKQLIDLIEVRRYCKWISYIRTNIQWKYYVRN